MKRLILVLPMLFLLAFSTACRKQEAVHVAAVLPLTGPSAVYGTAVKKGVELASEEIRQRHQSGDYPFEIQVDVHDSQSDPQQAAAILKDLFGHEKAMAAIGGVTDAEADAMTKVADNQHRVLLSPTAPGRDGNGGSRYVFRLFPSSEREGTKMGSFAGLELGLGKVVIVSPENRYARELAGVFRTEFERQGGKVLDTVFYSEGDDDLSRVAAQVRRLNPPAVYLAGTGPAVRRTLVAVEKGGFHGTVMTSSAFAARELLAEAGRDAEGVVISQGAFEPGSHEPRVEAFVKAYKKKYGEVPGLYAAYGYDAMQVLAHALADQGRHPRELWQGLRGLDGFKGVTGFIQFDAHGGVGQFPRVYVVRHGKLKSYEELREAKKKKLAELKQQIAQMGRNPAG